MKNIIIVAVVASFFLACSNDQLPEPQAPAFCETINVAYNTVVKPIIQKNCATSGCHVGGTAAPGDFRTFRGIRPFLNDSGIKFFVLDLRDDPENGMPPNWDTNLGPRDLTDEELETFKCWVLAGYPEN